MPREAAAIVSKPGNSFYYQRLCYTELQAREHRSPSVDSKFRQSCVSKHTAMLRCTRDVLRHTGGRCSSSTRRLLCRPNGDRHGAGGSTGTGTSSDSRSKLLGLSGLSIGSAVACSGLSGPPADCSSWDGSFVDWSAIARSGGDAPATAAAVGALAAGGAYVYSRLTTPVSRTHHGCSADGSVYDGQQQHRGGLSGWERHGEGTRWLTTGTVYSGDWAHGKRHGEGTRWRADGSQYRGGWKEGKRHGTGTLLGADGSKYAGGWKEGKRHGTGTLWGADGDTFRGDWKEGKRHGTGTLWEAGGGNYKGVWKEGNYHGTVHMELLGECQSFLARSMQPFLRPFNDKQTPQA